MIKEKSSYTDDLPVNIRIAEIEEYPLHFHQDIEFVYVLKGEINLKCGYFTYRITEGNVFTINGREVHGLYRTDRENVVALIQIENYFFSHYFSRLSGSCFRTFTNDQNDERLDALRSYFINILLESLKKEPGYKRQIVDQIVRLIAYLDEFFHYFSFENKVVVNARNDNPLSVERLGRIINFIYEKHAEKITLEDLSRLEHLSTYYISHLITEGTGMNFREFLCFARVEFSEMILLDTNKKVNVIAQEVGFSATSYYIKYFRKWFGMTPDEYRKKYLRDTKAPDIPAKLLRAEPGAVSKILHKNLNALAKQHEGSASPGSYPLEFIVDCQADPLGILSAAPELRCGSSVLTEQFEEAVRIARELNLKDICVTADLDRDPSFYEELSRRLAMEGILAKPEPRQSGRGFQSFGMDSAAAASCILRQGLNPGCREITMNSLIDGGERALLLKGEDGVLTSGLVPKPSYFAYKMLGHMQGSLIHWGKFHAVVRKPEPGGGKNSYCIVCYQHSEETENLCKRSSSIEETLERIGKFTDTLDIGIRLNGIFGSHQIIIYRLDAGNSLLDYAVKNGPDRRMKPEENKVLSWSVSPKVDISSETLSGSLYFSVSLKGLEAQCIMITPNQA